MGLLWAAMDKGGPLLLEEPELSLHPEIVRVLPQMLARVQRRNGRQIFVSTHSLRPAARRGHRPRRGDAARDERRRYRSGSGRLEPGSAQAAGRGVVARRDRHTEDTAEERRPARAVRGRLTVSAHDRRVAAMFARTWVPRNGSGRTEGPAYTSRLIEYATDRWRPDVAVQRADSLRRAVACLQRLGSGERLRREGSMHEVKSIQDLLNQIGRDEILLPEFQRGYVWNRDQVRGLMQSLYRKHPTGHLLIWRTYKPSLVRGGETARDGHSLLLLDGQQRLTTLYVLFKARRRGSTRASRSSSTCTSTCRPRSSASGRSRRWRTTRRG